MNKTFEPVIGMEVHVELSTQSKMFCSCPADHFEKDPNSQVCPVCLGLPGALPVPNKEAVRGAQLIGLALGCKAANTSKFDRKNYFYPDLPKGYQISQYDLPFSQNGKLDLPSGKTIRIRRVHLEEDTAKNIHTSDGTFINFNRSGVPLVEIVTEPDLSSSEETIIFLKKLVELIQHLNVSSCDMEKGTLRLEANISIRPSGSTELPTYKVEVKNVNSFRYTSYAIDFEVARHQEIIEGGGVPAQETRGFDENKGQTIGQRGKEEAHDYRYFPEPDIPPFKFTEEEITNLAKLLPELPDTVRERLIGLGLTAQAAQVLTQNPQLLAKFNQVLKAGQSQQVSPVDLANTLANRHVDLNSSADSIIASLKKENLTVSDIKLQQIISSVLKENPNAVSSYRKGKTQVIGFLLGLIIKKFPQKIDVAQVIIALEDKLKNYG